MKTLKTILAATLTVALALALPGSPSSAAGAGPDTLTITSPAPPATYEVGEEIKVRLNINEDGGEVFQANLQVSPNGSDSWTDVPGQTGKTTSAYGIYSFAFTPTGEQWLRATWTQNAVLRESEHLHLTPQPAVQQNGVLNLPTNEGKNWTADFTPGQSGKATQLQIQRIYTAETDEVNAAEETPEKGPWVTIATASQDGDGHVIFPPLSGPYPYRVEHSYRAVAGSNISANTQKFGRGQVTPKPTGLSAVYFNTNEGHAVDTRSRYFEGEFAMTADSKNLGCSDIGVADPSKRIKKSVMKGRGNYSWSFKRKSFTLKIDKKTSLCGMGVSKKYALVSQDYDKSFLRNALAQYVGSKFTHMAWTPKSKPVDFYLNGKYLGNYLLVERIAIQGSVTNAYKEPDDSYSNRVNIDALKGGDDQDLNGLASSEGGFTAPAYSEGQDTNGNHPNNQQPRVTGGYILEWDFRKGGDYNAYLGSDSGYVGVKEPEKDLDREGNPTGAGISPQQKSYISGYLNSADNAMRRDSCQSGDWENFIDKASAVDYYIAMEYMKPVDGNMWASVYMYKPRSGKLHFGPMWDFDLAAGSATRAGNVASSSSFYLRNNLGVSAQQSSNTWFNCLNKRSSFRSAVKSRWNAVKGSIDTNTFLEGQKNAIQTSADTSFSSAPNGASHSYRISSYQVIKGSSWISDYGHLKSWASSRKTWLSNNF